MPLTKSEIYQVIFDWLKAESGLTVVMANQKGPRPPRPYASLNFLNPSTRLGSSQDQQSVTDTVIGIDHSYTVATEGMRKAVASINIFGQNAIDTLALVRDSLDRPDVIETFERARIAHLDEGQINDLTVLQETEYEERGQMDLTISFVASSEVDVGTIEHVELIGHVGARELPAEIN